MRFYYFIPRCIEKKETSIPLFIFSYTVFLAYRTPPSVEHFKAKNTTDKGGNGNILALVRPVHIILHDKLIRIRHNEIILDATLW
jgi:hypothetical protein